MADHPYPELDWHSPQRINPRLASRYPGLVLSSANFGLVARVRHR